MKEARKIGKFTVQQRLMQKVNNSPGFQYHPSYKSLKITHLMLADDLIIFYKADPHSLQLIFQALKAFYDYIGLKPTYRNRKLSLQDAPRN